METTTTFPFYNLYSIVFLHHYIATSGLHKVVKHGNKINLNRVRVRKFVNVDDS